MNRILIFALILACVFGVSPKCEQEWQKVIDSRNNTSFSNEYILMFQYSGFTINNLGNYEDCEKLDDGRYVVFSYSISPVLVQTFCGPKVCTKDDWRSLNIAMIPSQKYDVIFLRDYQDDKYGSYSAGAICMIIFISLICTLVFTSSIFDYFADKSMKNQGWAKAYLSFSAWTNAPKLVTSRAQERLGKPDTLEILNSVRVMSICWVVMGHTVAFFMYFPAINNFITAIDDSKDPKFIIIYTATYGVDTFFWLSGFLMTYLFVIDVEKTKHYTPFRFIMVYVHRLLRILPLYMFIMCFFWSMQEYLGNGPLWYYASEFNKDCHKYWWANLLFVNNFVPDWKSTQCVPVAWYLAVDMQFFIISPIIILLYIKVNRIIGWASIGTLCIIGCITSYIIAEDNDLNISQFAAQNSNKYTDYLYKKPYTRFAPYVLGMACGFIVYSMRKFEDKGEVYDKIAVFLGEAQKNKIVRWATFIFGLILINILIFSQYDTYKHPGKNYEYDHWSDTANYMFMTFERLVYGLGLSCIFLPVLLGYFKPVFFIMSLSPWAFFARLNFVVYLIHLYIVEIVQKSNKTVTNFNTYTYMRDTLFFIFLSFFCAIPIVLGIEMPAANLEKLLFARGSPGPKNDASQNKVDGSILLINTTKGYS